ncbi:MAG: N-acetylmuramoyl-L-alanine amidase [Robiginitomaculum sp.]|nr:MAG: N-acetylmuramoyl-L-alanine amidase [Robiginitomaculum sp.]
MDASHLATDPTSKWTSPNFDDRSLPISMLVLHYTGMQSATHALERLCDPLAKVSAHYVIDEQGEVFALVPEDRRAWHAGLSCWQDVTDINSASIGIEIVNGGHDFGLPGFPEAQMLALIELCSAILARHKIAPQNIVGHNEIAPGRKIDPGERFAWAQLAGAGIGLWPGEPNGQRQSCPEPSASKVAGSLLTEIGYETALADFSTSAPNAPLSEFQRRYRPSLIDGLLDHETLDLIKRLHRQVFAPKP